MISTHKDWEADLCDVYGGALKSAGPADVFSEFMQVTSVRGFDSVRGNIADVLSGMAKGFECFCEPCGAVCIGTHQAAVSDFATVDRDADEDTVLLCHGRSMRPKLMLDPAFKSCETSEY